MPSEPISAKVFDKQGRCKILDAEEFRIVSKPLGENLPLIMKHAIARADPVIPCSLLKGRAGMFFGRIPDGQEQRWLRGRIIGFDIERVELSCRGNAYALEFTDSFILWDFAIFSDIVFNNQYSLRAVDIKDKVVVDAGANTGIFSLHAARLGAKKVYAFEPIRETFEQLKRNIRLNRLEKIIVPVNKALGDETGTVEMMYSYGCDVSASIARGKADKRQTVEITTIDDFLKGEPVAFIKMDVEGHESKVLLGAMKTIRKHKPILSFSAYHWPEDKTTLPRVVRDIRPDYACTLTKFAEEDFFCR